MSLYAGMSYEHKCEEVQRYEERILAVRGRKRRYWTVGELRALIEGVDDSTAVVVSHQPAYQHVGIQEPMIDVGSLAGQAWDETNSRLYCDGSTRPALIIE